MGIRVGIIALIMRSKIKVAYIVPVYNVNKYLDECLSSLQKITTPKEVIIVDDRGSENPYPIIEPYLKNEEFRCIKNRTNLGLGFARNEGLKVVSSDVTHIYFVDSDDFVDFTEIDKIFQVLKNDTTHLMSKHWNFTKTDRRQVLVKDYTLSNYPYNVWGSFWDAETAKKTMFRSKKFEDAPWVIDFFEDSKREKKVSIISEPTYYWRMRKSSISNEGRSAEDSLSFISEFSQIRNAKIYGWNLHLSELLVFEYLKLNRKLRSGIDFRSLNVPRLHSLWLRFAYFAQKFVFFDRLWKRNAGEDNFD